MNPWQVLGLSPTGDVDAVKQAYAEKAKLYHPEEHPEEFQTLHEAYRQAIRYARQHPAAPLAKKEAHPPGQRCNISKSPPFIRRLRTTMPIGKIVTALRTMNFPGHNFRISVPKTNGWDVRCPGHPVRFPCRREKSRFVAPNGKPSRSAGSIFPRCIRKSRRRMRQTILPQQRPPEADAPSPRRSRRSRLGTRAAFSGESAAWCDSSVVALIWWLPLPGSVALCIAYLSYQAYRDQIRRSWMLTIEEMVTECRFWPFSTSLCNRQIFNTEHLVLKILAGCLFLYRVIVAAWTLYIGFILTLRAKSKDYKKPPTFYNVGAFLNILYFPSLYVVGQTFVFRFDVADQNADQTIELTHLLDGDLAALQFIRQISNHVLILDVECVMGLIVRIIVFTLQLLFIGEVLIYVVRQELGSLRDLCPTGTARTSIQQLIDRIEQHTVFGVDQFISSFQLRRQFIVLNICRGRRSL